MLQYKHLSGYGFSTESISFPINDFLFINIASVRIVSTNYIG